MQLSRKYEKPRSIRNAKLETGIQYKSFTMGTHVNLSGSHLLAHTWAVKPMQICAFFIKNTPPIIIVGFIIAQNGAFVDIEDWFLAKKPGHPVMSRLWGFMEN